MAGSLRRILTIARGEAKRTGGTFGRRSTMLLVFLGVGTALLLPGATLHGLDFSSGLYRLAATDDSPLLPAALGSTAFRRVLVADPVAAIEAGQADIVLLGLQVYVPLSAEGRPTDKGQAAIAALQQALKDYNFRNLLQEPDQGAAFPVRVEAAYEVQLRPRESTPGLPSPTPPPASPTPDPPPVAEPPSGPRSPQPAPPVAAPSEGPVQGIVAPERSVSTPETLAPPFPFRSLILAYLFLIPMNFAVQVYAGSSIGERLGRRGESLLASPATARQIITGKALPYAGIMLGISAAIAWIIGGSWLSVLAMAPVVLAFLALEFMAAMVARSFRELTFLTVFISVSLTLYTFLPAVFTSVHPVALVSPITLVVLDLRHAEVPLLHMLYATLPLTVFSLALFYIGAGLYREEDLFHQKPVHAKLLDALARHVKGLGSGAKLTMITIPCVFVAELMMLTFLFAWPAPVTLGAVLLSVALVEEAFKGAPSYAALSRGKIAPRRALAFGALAGLGFFVAEKGILLASLVGLFDLPAGGAIFGGSGPVLGTTGLAQLGLLLLPPMALHVATASFTALGARFGKRAFLATFLAAGMAHAAYNYYNVVQATGGALR